MSKSSRLNQGYRANASKLHRSMGDLLRGNNSPFRNMRTYQEYPVNLINPYFDSGREKIDWVILDLNIAIELHGKQHYEPVRFGGISSEEAERNFKEQKRRDIAKAQAVQDMGWRLVVFKYDEALTLQRLLQKIEQAEVIAVMETEPAQQEPNKYQRLKEERKQKAREYRKSAYRRIKEWFKTMKQ